MADLLRYLNATGAATQRLKDNLDAALPLARELQAMGPIGDAAAPGQGPSGPRESLEQQLRRGRRGS